jgi:hypothetical protein
MISRLVILCTASAIGGALFVLACGNDSPATAADASAPACDCAAAEPPLMGRIVEKTMEFPVGAQGISSNGMFCDPGAIMLSGGCRLEPNNVRGINVQANAKLSDSGSRTWLCQWDNQTDQAVTGIVDVTCLTPPPAQ